MRSKCVKMLLWQYIYLCTCVNFLMFLPTVSKLIDHCLEVASSTESILSGCSKAGETEELWSVASKEPM